MKRMMALFFITSTLCAAQTTHIYSFEPENLSMIGGWSLKYGGRYWTTLFGGTLSAHDIRIDNIYDAHGESYENWGAYVWNAPYCNEVIVRIRFRWERNGYLGTFNPALFADTVPIESTGTAIGTVSNVRWHKTGAGHLGGTQEITFDVSENITCAGLGFIDTSSDTQNYVAFRQIEIETCRQESPPPNNPLVEGEYLQVQDGHFYYNGQRHRLWGINFVSSVKQMLHNLRLSFDRIQDAGFNAVRLNLFDGTFLDGVTADTWHVAETMMGSNSAMDRLDYAMSLAKERGMFFWLSFDRRSRGLIAGDYDILPDDGHRAEWTAMIAASPIRYLVYVDERAAAVHIAYAKAILNHVNPYTGKRYADDEVIGLAEIFNENGFLSNFSPTKLYPNLPAYVRSAIDAKLNTWLTNRYGSSSALIDAWKVGGVSNLYADESLASNTIRFDYGPLGSGTRLLDMTHFTAWLYNDYNQRFIDEIRTTGFVAPITPTGQFDYHLLRYYGAQMSGDFVANGIYGFACQPSQVPPSDPYYPFRSRLRSFPYFEQPIDLMRVKDKPYAYYEVNDYRPNPFGVEFPLRIATMMAWQDGDAVFWFNWDDSGYLPPLNSDTAYTQSQLPMPDAGYPNAGLILANDEVQLAAIKSAGALFVNGLLPAAPSPLEWTIGKDLLFPPNPASWSELEWWVRSRAWREGVRVTFNPEGSSVNVPGMSLGSSVNQGPYVHYTWADSSASRMQINAPAVRAIVGFTGSSAQLGDLMISGINGEFSSIVVLAEDGLPLDQSRHILVTLARESINTDYAFNPDNLTGSGFAEDLARALSSPGGSVGTAPVIVDRVSATLVAPWLAGMNYQKYNFARECYEEGWISKSSPSISISAAEPLFYFRLTMVRIPGDADGNGAVDVGDLGILATNYGGLGKSWDQGDFTGDGKVDVGDLGILAANYGTGVNGASDFASDYAKIFGIAVEEGDTEMTKGNSLCSGLSLPLIAGVFLLALMLAKHDV